MAELLTCLASLPPQTNLSMGTHSPWLCAYSLTYKWHMPLYLYIYMPPYVRLSVHVCGWRAFSLSVDFWVLILYPPLFTSSGRPTSITRSVLRFQHVHSTIHLSAFSCLLQRAVVPLRPACRIPRTPILLYRFLAFLLLPDHLVVRCRIHYRMFDIVAGILDTSLGYHCHAACYRHLAGPDRALPYAFAYLAACLAALFSRVRSLLTGIFISSLF